MQKTCVLLIMLLFSCAKGPGSGEALDSKIYGGQKSSYWDWPSVVSLTTGELGSFCTGVAITKELILTAAHCLTETIKEHQIFNKLTVYTGRGRDSHFTGKYKVKDYGIHPNYLAGQETSQFDFAYIVVDHELSINESKIIPPINDYQSHKYYTDRTEVTLVGYGKREDDKRGRKAWVKSTIWRAKEYEFYAGGGGKDSCYGDSGGPVFVRLIDGSLRLIGITSRPVYKSGACGLGSIFGKINSAMDWLISEGLYR